MIQGHTLSTTTDYIFDNSAVPYNDDEDAEIEVGGFDLKLRPTRSKKRINDLKE